MKTDPINQRAPSREQKGTSGNQGRVDSDQVAKLNRMLDKKKSLAEIRDEIEQARLQQGIVMPGDAIAAGEGMGATAPATGMAGMSELFAGLAGKGAQPETGETAEPDGGAAALLAQGGLKQQPAVPADIAPAAPAEKPGAAKMDNLVERILVSVPKADGAAEVRIKVDPKLLPNTEIAIASRPGEGLSVEFLSDDVNSQRFLLPNLGALRDRLAEKTGDTVAVRMSENASSDTGDGRSRNRRNLYDEIGDKRV